MNRFVQCTVLALGILTLAGSAMLNGAAQETTPTIDPAHFTTEVTNPYFPLPVGALRNY